MKWMVSGLVVLVALTGAYFFIPGFRARTDVAGEKAIQKLDRLLGETKVQKKDVQLAMGRMEKAIEELTKGRISSQVQAERLGKQVKELEAKVGDTTTALNTLKKHLESETPAEIGGKTYTKDQVSDMAKKVLDARKTLTAQLESMKQAEDRLEKTATALKNREEEGRAKLVSLKAQLDVIDAELVSLTAMKSAAAAAGSSDQALAVNFDEIEKKVANLHDKVKMETRFEEEKWKAGEARKDLESVEHIISTTNKSSKDTLAEIDKALSGK